MNTLPSAKRWARRKSPLAACAGADDDAVKVTQMYLLKLMLQEINIYVKLLDKYKKIRRGLYFQAELKHKVK